MTETARPMQSKPVARAVSRCYYLGRNDTDHTVLFAIGSRRYEYTLSPQQIESVDYLCHKVSILRGLNYAKRKGKPATLATST